jgi:hypothetical protein
MASSNSTTDLATLPVWNITEGGYTKNCTSADGKVKWGAFEHTPTVWYVYATDAKHAVLRARELGMLPRGYTHAGAQQVTDDAELAELVGGCCVQ